MSDQIDKAQFITLADAAEETPYSQEYLSLRARQGKLRAVKRGRNWYTTPGWLDDYLQQVDVSRSDLRTIEVVQEAAAPSDIEPVNDPIAAIKPVPLPEPEEPFVFHPAQTAVDDAADQSSVVGSVLSKEQSNKPTGSQFSWDDDEPKQIAGTPEHAMLMAHLQEKVDQAIATEEPVIELARTIDEAPTGVTPLGDGFVELGMNDTPVPADTISYSYTNEVEESEEPEDKPSTDLSWLAKPALSAAVILLVFVSSFSTIDKVFQIRRNIGAGAGIVIHNTGQTLIAVGQMRQEKREAKLNTTRQVALPILGVDASENVATTAETDTAPEAGTVAGASDTQEKPGFWATVLVGLQIVLGQY